MVVAEDLHSRKGKGEEDQNLELIKALVTCLLLKELQMTGNLLLLLHPDTSQEEEEVEEEEAGEVEEEEAGEEEAGEEEEAEVDDNDNQDRIFQMILMLQPHYYSITE